MKTLKNILAITIPSLIFTFVLLELVFRFIIPATDSPKYKFNKEYGFLVFDGEENREGLYTVGRLAQIRAHWKLNNKNWNSAVDFLETKDSTKQRIVVIGASFVEGLLVEQQENFPYLLSENLKPYAEVYPIGISGLPLSGYPNAMRYAIDKFHPDLVILYNHAMNINQAFYQEGENNIHPKIKVAGDSVSFVNANEYVPNRIKRMLSASAFVRYIVGNLQVENIAPKAGKAGARGKAEEPSDRAKKGCEFMFKGIRATAGNIPVVVLQDVERQEIYSGISAEQLSDHAVRTMIAASCDKNGIHYLDLAPCFIDRYSKEHLKFEFPIDNHWNAYGNKVVSDCITGYLTTADLVKK